MYVFDGDVFSSPSRVRDLSMRAASIVNKSTYYLLSLEPVKRSGRRHVATYGFTRVRSSRDSHSRESSPSPPPGTCTSDAHARRSGNYISDES